MLLVYSQNKDVSASGDSNQRNATFYFLVVSLEKWMYL